MLRVVLIRIYPHAGLLRRHRGRDIRRDIRIINSIRLVRRGLKRQQPQHAVIHALRTRPAVLNHQIRIFPEYLLIPAVQRVDMTEHRAGTGFRVKIRTEPLRLVVIHLEVADSIIPHQPVHDIHAVLIHVRIAEIQQIPLVVDMPLPMPADKPVVRKTFRKIRDLTHGLNLQPHAENHALASGIIRQCPDAVRKPLRRLDPLADPVPPESLVIPAAVHAVVFAAHRRGFVNDCLFLLLCRVSEEAVHVIIEHNMTAVIIRIRPAHGAAVLRQCADAVRKIASHHAKRRGNGCEASARLQIEPPAVLLLRRAGQAEGEPPLVLGIILNVPLTRGLHLKHIGFLPLPVPADPHGKIFHAGP